MEPKQVVRWVVRQGALKALLPLAARADDPFSRLATDPAVQADPYGEYARLRERGEIVPGRLAFVTARHDVVSELVRTEAFRSGFPHEALPHPVQRAMDWARDPSALGFLERPSMLVTDGPDHTRYRRLVSKAFTARAIEDLRTRVGELSGELLDQLAARDVGDVMATFAAELPIHVITEILGVPADERDRFRAWARDITPLFDFGQGYATFVRAEQAIREINVWLARHLEHLRRNPGPNLLSQVLRAGAEDRAAGGPGLSPLEETAVAGLVLGAGFETTVNLLGNGAVLLMRHPDALADLLADPSGWRNAVEEILRFDSPIQNTVRHPLVDTEVRGVRVPRGRFVILLLGGANRDPAVFADPDTFDIRRPNARDHLSFSAGPHFCLGSALARMEAEVGLRMLFERHPALAAAGPPHRRPTRNFRGYDRIPVRLTAGVPAAS